MKMSHEWLDDVAKLTGVAPPETERLIRQIQADALGHATQLMTANADSQERAFNAVFNEMLRLKDPK